MARNINDSTITGIEYYFQGRIKRDVDDWAKRLDALDRPGSRFRVSAATPMRTRDGGEIELVPVRDTVTGETSIPFMVYRSEYAAQRRREAFAPQPFGPRR